MTNERMLEESLGRLEHQRRETKDQLDRERLTRVTSDLIKTITAPAFIESMRVARERADGGASVESAADLLSISALRRAGLDIPEDFRMTSRVFEDRSTGFRLELKEPIGGMEPLGWGACAGGGGLTFCGCGGFST
jgi:hypothetical protein